jgi:hypothetical protein
MINNENLEKLKQSLVENENKWNENYEMMKTAFKEKYGVFFNISKSKVLMSKNQKSRNS